MFDRIRINSFIPDDEDFSLEGLVLSDKQRAAINNLSMVNQLSIIRRLREEQGVAKPKKAGYPEKRYAENAFAGVENDGMRENIKSLAPHSKSKAYQLGTLSSIHEANGNPAIIGEDNSGGPSYGLYQIATRTGTMKKYIQYLKKKTIYSKYADLLEKVGGAKAALLRTSDFENMWINLSKDSEFNSSQKNFIIETHLGRLLDSIVEKNILDIENRHPVIKDALYSMSVQHYRAPFIVNTALYNLKQKFGMTISDEHLLRELYKQRTDYVNSLPESQYKGDGKITKKEKYNIINYRYPQELQNALDYLK